MRTKESHSKSNGPPTICLLKAALIYLCSTHVDFILKYLKRLYTLLALAYWYVICIYFVSFLHRVFLP